LAQYWLPESARIQVKRQYRLIWLENGGPENWSLVKDHWPTTNDALLLTIQFNDQLLIDWQVDVFALGQRQDFSLVVVAINLQPVGGILVAGEFLCWFQNR
jgi:hypothetical protein